MFQPRNLLLLHLVCEITIESLLLQPPTPTLFGFVTGVPQRLRYELQETTVNPTKLTSDNSKDLEYLGPEKLGRAGMEKRHTLIFDSRDIAFLSPVNFSWQTHVTRFQVGRAASLCLVGKVASHSKVEEAVLSFSEVSKVVHGQHVRVTLRVVLSDFLV